MNPCCLKLIHIIMCNLFASFTHANHLRLKTMSQKPTTLNARPHNETKQMMMLLPW